MTRVSVGDRAVSAAMETREGLSLGDEDGIQPYNVQRYGRNARTDAEVPAVAGDNKTPSESPLRALSLYA
jgi:hypothetical protein